MNYWKQCWANVRPWVPLVGGIALVHVIAGLVAR